MARQRRWPSMRLPPLLIGCESDCPVRRARRKADYRLRVGLGNGQNSAGSRSDGEQVFGNDLTTPLEIRNRESRGYRTRLAWPIDVLGRTQTVVGWGGRSLGEKKKNTNRDALVLFIAASSDAIDCVFDPEKNRGTRLGCKDFYRKRLDQKFARRRRRDGICRRAARRGGSEGFARGGAPRFQESDGWLTHCESEFGGPSKRG